MFGKEYSAPKSHSQCVNVVLDLLTSQHHLLAFDFTIIRGVYNIICSSKGNTAI